MIEIYSLLSGSSANSTLITDGKTHILIDCGTSGKRIFDALKRIDVTPEMIDAILVSHEHTDHTKGVGVLARKLKIPVYATKGTHRFLNAGAIDEKQIKTVTTDITFGIGDIEITPFRIPHDAAEPCAYTFVKEGEKSTVVTDIGHVNNYMMNYMCGSKNIILESNHDIDMLRFGEYPYPLKQRILSDVGHLSNALAAQTALELVKSGTEHILLGHLSDKNNIPEVAQMETYNLLRDNGIEIDRDVTLQVASRYDITAIRK